jgi:hypothetical protein
MTLVPARLSILTHDSGLEVSLDGSPLSRDSLLGLSLTPGEHAVAVRNPASGVILTSTFVSAPQSTRTLEARFDAPSTTPVLESLLFPGLGQALHKEALTGVGFAASFIAATALALSYNHSGLQAIDTYNDLLKQYQTSTSADELMKLRFRVPQAYSDIKPRLRLQNIFTWAAAGIYVLSAADAYFFVTKIDYIESVAANMPLSHSQPSRSFTFQARIPL